MRDDLLSKVSAQEQDLQKKLAVFTDDAEEALAYLRQFVVDGDAAYEAAAAQAATYRDVLDQFEVARKEIVAPLNAEVKRINDKVRPVSTFLETAIKLLKGSMGAYVAKSEETQRRALEQAQQLAVDGELEGAQQALVLAQEETPRVAGVSIVDEWDFEIVDVDAIPRGFMTPNLTAIRSFVKSTKRESAIPGVKSFVKKTVRQRRSDGGGK